MDVRHAVSGSGTTCTQDWSGHAGSLSHLRMLGISSFLLRSVGVVREVLVGSNLGSNQIDVGHCTWPCGIPTEPLRVEPVRIKVSVEIFTSLASSEDEKDEQYEGEDTDGTSDDTTGDGAGVRRGPTAAALGLGGEDELGGPHCLRLDMPVRVGGSGNHVGKTCQ